ncbi:MAG: protein kinase family protein [Gammaproteobacteria bacterium]|nr:protein kinase family protein [Gammaproteobacteria bacterium]
MPAEPIEAELETEPEPALPRGFLELQPRDFVLLHAGDVIDVWRAELPGRRLVALKAVKARWLKHGGAAALLRREHRLLETLRDPRIVEPVLCNEDSGGCVLALEYLEGGDLVPLAGAAPRHWLYALLDVVLALERVHGAGFVHGDVKARNVLFASPERAKLIDFGSATACGEPLGRGGRTAAHVPRDPRLAARLAGDAASASPALDVYALAVLAYELIAGRLPAGDTIGPPLAAAARAAPAVAPLSERVLATLQAEEPADIGTLRAFRDVIESVRRSRTA